MSDVRRVYVEKKPPFAVSAAALLEELRGFLRIRSAEEVRILIRYDVEHVPGEVFREALNGVFAEPPLDDVILDRLPEEMTEGVLCFSVESLPGQYDQRADSCAQALRLIDESVTPGVRTAVTYLIRGHLSAEEISAIQSFLVNPVDSRIASEEIPESLAMQYEEPGEVEVLEGFTAYDDAGLERYYASLSLAMTFRDFQMIRDYFRDEEKRNPTITEIRVLDTYWSDHCRHTTFATEIKDIRIEEGPYAEAFRSSLQAYLDARKEVYETEEKQKEKAVCLMDVATMGMKLLKKRGILTDMEESEENNACTIISPVEIRDEKGETRTEEWLIFFKNETHNHPTEIEPFGGAATCLGGAIRDPLSGRGYVYQAMRVTGAADPTQPSDSVLPGKLPQKKIVKDAAKGYSSYGNQIGLATGLVEEIYHPGYVAKRMEIGAVLGAAPRKAVRRLSPEAGDAVLLIGGRTGRDGIGGATGSSKAHTESSLESCGAEVQKGNALTERKIQRLFRREEVSELIKKCNDFGAGGVCVAIGELADGLAIELDLVPKKYEGLDGTELAISESQERMAVVCAAEDTERFLSYCAEENLEAVQVAKVTDSARLQMRWRGKMIVDLSRAFLNTNGASQECRALLKMPEENTVLPGGIRCDAVRQSLDAGDVRGAWLASLMDLNVCSTQGLAEMFDASIGTGTVVMPFGGKYQLTPAQAMVAKVPVLYGETDDATVMSYGFDPFLSSGSPFHGASCAVLHSVAKAVAAGCHPDTLHFTFQEYFGRMTEDPARWGMVLQALLGAFSAQVALKTAAIGGKDSMSGTFRDIDVPPTLVSFAVGRLKARDAVTPELKREGNYVVLFEGVRDDLGLPGYEKNLELYAEVNRLMREKKIVSCIAPDAYGIAPALSKMAFGNGLGLQLEETLSPEELFSDATGHLLAEVDVHALAEVLRVRGAYKIAVVTQEKCLRYRKAEIYLPEAQQCYMSRLEKVFPTTYVPKEKKRGLPEPLRKEVTVCTNRHAKPRVLIPVFPGTNCEYDLTRAFERAGAEVHCAVFLNRSEEEIRESVLRFEKEIDQSQIIMFPGGFSAGDEPDGSAKFFAVTFRNERIREATHRLLYERDGLALGICNGFQAMIKLGLLPDGRISGQSADSPTLTTNLIGRHVSRMAYLKVISANSPWLALTDPRTVYASPVSHGEGRFVASEEIALQLYGNGQVATCYCDPEGHPAFDPVWNPNGSVMAIEGILSPDGRCYGKMAHAERRGEHIAVNTYGEQDMRIFEAGVRYFSGEALSH
ncbi:MAG: phosphoribosylformylglycinamidine synthase [Lachnospiraceae bacterium]|nr:phosphoribosylformylglycinamidine synthase [Lachnospiraceae bacterium]